MSRLNSLFEEDIAMQDALDDADMVSDSEDIVLGIIDSRYNALKDSETHLFDDEKEEKYNEDGLTDEEENQINMALLDKDEDDLFDDIDEDDDLED